MLAHSRSFSLILAHAPSFSLILAHSRSFSLILAHSPSGQGKPLLSFFSMRSLTRVAQLELDGAAVVPIIWHPRLNQIILGNNDGRAYALYDPTMSVAFHER